MQIMAGCLYIVTYGVLEFWSLTICMQTNTFILIALSLVMVNNQEVVSAFVLCRTVRQIGLHLVGRVRFWKVYSKQGGD